MPNSENLNLLCALLDSFRSEGLSWSFDHFDYDMTLHDTEDGFREVYRIRNEPDGASWSKSE